MAHRIRLEGTDDAFDCPAENNVLRSMEALGRKGVPVGCRGGGCGVCKVQVVSGDYYVRRMSRACVTGAEQEQGVVLACQLYPRADLALRVIGKMTKAWDRSIKNLDKK